MENSKQKLNKNTSLVNMLKKKVDQSHGVYKENVSFEDDHVQTFHKRTDAVSQKVLKTSIVHSKKELCDLLKREAEEKHAIEIKILNAQLEREKLHMQLMQKEIAIKDCLLKRLQNTIEKTNEEEEELQDVEYLDEYVDSF